MRTAPCVVALVSILVAGCGLLEADGYTVSGRAIRGSSVRAARGTVTHVMAVNPETAAPQRRIAAVGDDGSFALTVPAGQPYVLVFIDSTAVGADMVLATFRAETLDTLLPTEPGEGDLGEVAVDPETLTATAGISYDDLLAQLGLDPALAEYLGSIDDLSLRYANPDIDGDGVIDLAQDHQFALDVHVRASMHKGTAAANVTIADLTDQFLSDAGAEVATPIFNLTSIYAIYPASFDDTEYVAPGVPGAALQHGGAYTVTLADGSPAAANTSFSALGFGDRRGFGADYDHVAQPGLELPGSGGSPATLAFTLGGIGTTLTFTNVITRTHASLTDAGSLAIFVKLVTAGGVIGAVDYKWMKRTSAASWVPATADEIALTISGDGGHLAIHGRDWSDEIGVAIPRQPSGTVAWTAAATRPDDLCGLAVSYDDKLGLRHFEGGADAHPGASCTP